MSRLSLRLRMTLTLGAVSSWRTRSGPANSMHRGPAQTGMRPLPGTTRNYYEAAGLVLLYSATALRMVARSTTEHHRLARATVATAASASRHVRSWFPSKTTKRSLSGNVKFRLVNCAKVMPLRFSSRMTSARTTWAGANSRRWPVPATGSTVSISPFSIMASSRPRVRPAVLQSSEVVTQSIVQRLVLRTEGEFS